MSEAPFKVCVWVEAETHEVLNTGECCGKPDESQRITLISPLCSKEKAKELLDHFASGIKELWNQIAQD